VYILSVVFELAESNDRRIELAALQCPFPAIYVASPRARGRVGLLEVPGARGRFPGSEHEHGRVIH